MAKLDGHTALSRYYCKDCDTYWFSLWDSFCDDECPSCGVVHSPALEVELDKDYPLK